MSTGFDLLDEAGHDLTCAHGLSIGVTTYVCERCGALLLTRDLGEVVLFHVAPGNPSTVEKCTGTDPPPEHERLKAKLDELERQDYERLKQI
jgi:hypothetical protein